MLKKILLILLIFVLIGSLNASAFPNYEDIVENIYGSFEAFFVITTYNLIGGNAIFTNNPDVEPLCDQDKDGYISSAKYCGGDDCKDKYPEIHPGALEVCGDGFDNNCDGTIDEGCSSPFSSCGNKIVNEGEICDDNSVSCKTSLNYDGIKTCNALCDGWGNCVSTEYCGDGIKNGNEICDGDSNSCTTSTGVAGDQNCLNDCAGYSICTSGTSSGGSEICSNKIDDDNDCDGDTNGDGQSCSPGDIGVDCLDSDCAGALDGYEFFMCCDQQNACDTNAFCDVTYGICTESKCDDNINNDKDPFLDCYDWDCSADSNCEDYYGSAEFDCEDGYDNDQDDYYDCDDSECFGSSECGGIMDSLANPPGINEVCDDLIDNDQNGFIDCDDSECACNGNSVLQGINLNSEQKLKIENNLLVIQPHLSAIKENLEVLRVKYKKDYPLEANWAGVLVTKITTIEVYIDVLLKNGNTWPYSKYYSTLKAIKEELNGVIDEINKMPFEHEN